MSWNRVILLECQQHLIFLASFLWNTARLHCGAAVKLLLVIPVSLVKNMLVQVQATSRSIQLTANASGRTADDGHSLGPLPSMWESWMEFLAPYFIFWYRLGVSFVYRTIMGTKICKCLSPWYKMVWDLHITHTHTHPHSFVISNTMWLLCE